MPDDLPLAAIPFHPRAAAFLATRDSTLTLKDIPDLLRCYGLRPDGIVDLTALGLSPEDIAARKDFIGGSEIRILVDGDPQEINQLWRVKTGRDRPEDLSDLFHVQLGNATEPFNLAWIEKRMTAHLKRWSVVTRGGQRVHHERHAWAAMTLDGWLDDYFGESRVVQCKHVNGFSKIDNVVDRYQPQGQWEAGVSGADGTILSVIIGTNEPEYRDLQFDPSYFGELMERAERFMACVKNDVAPTGVAPMTLAPKAAPKAIRVGERDMTGDNAWADAAGRWLQNKDAVASFKAAEKDIKELVPKDVQRTFGHGIEVVANKAGALSIKALPLPTNKD